MKIQLISDTHTYSVEISEEADLVVHAGDIGNGHIGHILNFVDACKNKNKDYVLVLGNHDFYGLQKISNVYKELDKYNINYLTAGKEFNYKGFTFVGGVFFTDFTLNAKGPWDIDKNKSDAKRSISDFFEILNDKNQFITPEEYITLHNIDWNWIQQYRNKPNTIVITHFPPNPVALHDYWKEHGGSLNSYFINTKDLTGFKYWLCAHVHDAFDKTVDGCRVINNAYGYRSEQNLNGYVNKLLIEVSGE